MVDEKEEVLKKAHQVQHEKNDEIYQLGEQMANLKESLIAKEDSPVDTPYELARNVNP